jgi:hypothetical protein
MILKKPDHGLAEARGDMQRTAVTTDQQPGFR